MLRHSVRALAVALSRISMGSMARRFGGMLASMISAVAGFLPRLVWQMHGGRRQTLLKDATEIEVNDGPHRWSQFRSEVNDRFGAGSGTCRWKPR
jgi:hypothetical protein